MPEDAIGQQRDEAAGDDPVALAEDQHSDVGQDDGLEQPADSEPASALEGQRPWRVALALKALRRQVDARVPARNKASDGTIGDAAHATRDSDHNPWVLDGATGVVTAMDITHDPAHGCDAGCLAETLRQSRDRRLKYIISNRRIASAVPKGSVPAWTWRAYTGVNPHNKHCHISVVAEKARYDSEEEWAIAGAFGGALEGERDAAGDDDDLAAVDAAVRALTVVADDESLPLLQRLTEIEAEAEALRGRYLEATRARATAADGALEGTAPTFDQLRGEYETLFANCSIRPDKTGEAAWYRKLILKGRSRYEEASARTGVPWWFVAIVHGMEAGFDFAGHLHNGDPLTARTVQVPRGRPSVWNPPSDWLSSAIDALEHEGFTGKTDWSVARALYRWEAYNGFGYRKARVHIASPYLWSFSNHYARGKYTADGHYNPNAVSKQCGTAVMLKALQKAGDVAL